MSIQVSPLSIHAAGGTVPSQNPNRWGKMEDMTQMGKDGGNYSKCSIEGKSYEVNAVGQMVVYLKLYGSILCCVECIKKVMGVCAGVCYKREITQE